MYKTYISLVWRDVARGDARMSQEASWALEAFLSNLFDLVATEAATRLAKYRTKHTLSAPIVGRAVRGVLKRPLAQLVAAAIERSHRQSFFVDGLSASRMHTYLKRGGYADRVSPEAGAAMAATLDVVLRKVLRAAHPFVHQSGLKTLRMEHVLDGLHADPHLRDLRPMIGAAPIKKKKKTTRVARKATRKPATTRRPARRKPASAPRRKRRVSFAPDPVFMMYHPSMPPSATAMFPGGAGPGPGYSPSPSPSATATASSDVVQLDSVDKLQMLLNVNATTLQQYLLENYKRASFLRAFHPDRCIAGAAAVTQLFRGIGINVNLTLGGPVACEQIFTKFSSLFENNKTRKSPSIVPPMSTSRTGTDDGMGTNSRPPPRNQPMLLLTGPPENTQLAAPGILARMFGGGDSSNEAANPEPYTPSFQPAPRTTADAGTSTDDFEPDFWEYPTPNPNESPYKYKYE